MTRQAYRREHTGSAATDRIQRPAQQTAKKLGACPFLEGRLISVAFVAGIFLTVNHGLGVPAAFFPCRQPYVGSPVPGTFAENPSQAGLDANNQLSIVSSNTVTVDLWFYPRASQVIPNGASQSP